MTRLALFLAIGLALAVAVKATAIVIQAPSFLVLEMLEQRRLAYRLAAGIPRAADYHRLASHDPSDFGSSRTNEVRKHHSDLAALCGVL
jgi:hypothetical protein